MTSKIGNSFVHEETNSAVLIAEGDARPGPIVRFIPSAELGRPPLPSRCVSSLSGLPDMGGAGDATDATVAVFEKKRRTSNLTVECCANVASVFIVRKKRYCTIIGAWDSACEAVPSLLQVCAFSTRAHVR